MLSTRAARTLRPDQSIGADYVSNVPPLGGTVDDFHDALLETLKKHVALD